MRFREAIEDSTKKWGPFNRILVKSHCGGPSSGGPSLQFKKGGPVLSADTLEPATILAIKRALKPNGIFVIASCGYRDDYDKAYRTEWNRQLQEWANKLQRKVYADPTKSDADHLIGSVFQRGSTRAWAEPNEARP